MANEEHLGILRQGAKVWNRWRETHLEIQPDLRGVDLEEFDLTDADLYNAYLLQAHLKGANLHGADLTDATMNGTDLTYVALSWANLFHADLSQANLSGANLFHANLSQANLSGANLKDADLNFAKMKGTVLNDLDLCHVKGLETVQHEGPSDIGIQTIYQSHGEISEAFLRGAGIPDSFIEYARSLIGKPIDYYSCFISYSSKDQAFAERLHADLQSKGVRCWFAPHDLKIGAKIRTSIDESIRLHDKLLLVLSRASVNSQWVEQEVETALARERKENKVVLFPVRLDQTVMKQDTGWPALLHNTRNIGDFTRWKDHDAYQKAFERLLRDLKAAP